MTRKIRVAGINFDHFHMGDNLRFAAEHPGVEIVGVCDETPARMTKASSQFNIPENRVFTEYQKCLEVCQPDLVILCPATAEHALWTDRIAPSGAAILMEKPFAATLVEADQMIATAAKYQITMAINWPLAWVAAHQTAYRLLSEGAIGELLECHYYGGNRGPLWHTADKIAKSADQVASEKPHSWFYRKQRGGGSMLDYLGYGATLGTWYMNGRKPIDVTAVVDRPTGLEVDEHSITILRYEFGLSRLETRWGTFTDPWSHQTRPECGFVLVGTHGTLTSFDYQPTVRLQNDQFPGGWDFPTDALLPPNQNPVQYMVDCLCKQIPVTGPLSLEISRIGQQIVDTAFRSAQEERTLQLAQ